MNKKIAVILAGSGARDGSEIRESIFSLLSLEEKGASYQLFASIRDQFEVVDHKSGKTVSEKRNILVEAARIGRGNITPLSELEVDHFDALLLPGGFGFAKNYSTFPSNGIDGHVDDEIKKVIISFHAKKKKIGAICIAPMIVAMALREHKIEVTLGSDPETIVAVTKLGAKHIIKEKDEIHIDYQNRVISTPAYMYGDNTLPSIYKGIKALVTELLES